jgi:hypothetical protein
VTAPVQPAPEQNPAQVPVQQPVPAPAAAPEPAPVDPNAPWPPDEQTLMQLQMDARFSIIEESGDEATPETADRQVAPSPGPTPPAPQQAQQAPVKE